MEEHIMRLAKNLMIFLGAWLQDDFFNKRLQKLYHIYSYIIQGSYIILCFLFLAGVYNLLWDNDVNKLTYNGMICIIPITSAAKITIFRSRKFQNFIRKIIEEEQNMLTNGWKDEEKIYLNYVNYVYKISIAIMVVVGGSASYETIDTITHAMTLKNVDAEKPMIIYARLPFDQDKHYGASLIIQIIFTAISVAYFSTTQILYISILTFLKYQLRILQYRFRHFDEYKKRFESSISDMDAMNKLIGFHDFVLRFVEEVNDEVKYLSLMDFLLIALNIAMVALRLISGGDQLVFTVGYMVGSISQLFILAWYANEISIESIAVSDAVYEMNWYEKSLQVQDMALLVILRSQKPSALTIGPFYPLTNQAIISVINAAYSYVTIMRSRIEGLDEP